MINEIRAYPVSFRHNCKNQNTQNNTDVNPHTSNLLPMHNSRFIPSAVLMALFAIPLAVGCNNSPKDPFERELEKIERQGSPSNVEFGPDGDIESIEANW